MEKKLNTTSWDEIILKSFDGEERAITQVYRISDILGVGGFGIVVQARDR